MSTQDGYDWPNGCTDERWPAPSDQPAPQPEPVRWTPPAVFWNAAQDDYASGFERGLFGLGFLGL